MENIIICVTVLFAVTIPLLIYSYIEKKNERNDSDKEKEYVLNVITYHKDGGVSSHWFGWSSDWLFTLNEAERKRERLYRIHNYDKIEILKFNNEQSRIKRELENAGLK